MSVRPVGPGAPRLLVLGGCGGLGRSLVEHAIGAGWSVAIFDLESSIARHPPSDEARAFACDAANRESLKAAFEDLAQSFGGIDGFVNLAGFVGSSLPVVETDEADWRSIVDGNLHAAYLAATFAIPLLQQSGRSPAMVLTASGLGAFARPGYGPYAASKAAIIMLTKQLALEAAPKVRVNCVAPSAVDTAFLRGGTGRSEENEPPRFDIDAYGRAVPLGRIAVPDDIAGPILFLLSEKAGYVTGQTMHVNGGAYMP